MKWQWIVGGLLLVAPLVGGCAPSDQGPSVGNLGLNFADDWTGARAIDKASVDLSRGNLRGLDAAGTALDRRIEKGSRASFNIAASWMTGRAAEGQQNGEVASNSDAGVDRDESRRDSNRAYRAALAFLPSNPQKWRGLDPELLNSLGYFLADQGDNRADFERAEKLTALAIQLSPANDGITRYIRASGPGDSHAWALFRLGRTADALKAQSAIITTVQKEIGSSPYFATPAAKAGRAEIIYHWGAMCRVAGHEKAARDAFQFALSQNPPLELQEILKVNLDSDDVA